MDEETRKRLNDLEDQIRILKIEADIVCRNLEPAPEKWEEPLYIIGNSWSR